MNAGTSVFLYSNEIISASKRISPEGLLLFCLRLTLSVLSGSGWLARGTGLRIFGPSGNFVITRDSLRFLRALSRVVSSRVTYSASTSCERKRARTHLNVTRYTMWQFEDSTNKKSRMMWIINQIYCLWLDSELLWKSSWIVYWSKPRGGILFAFQLLLLWFAFVTLNHFICLH